jgi:hypothetical protein
MEWVSPEMDLQGDYIFVNLSWDKPLKRPEGFTERDFGSKTKPSGRLFCIPNWRFVTSLVWVENGRICRLGRYDKFRNFS